jgi:SAM-dependent methyltransferase
MLNIQTYRLSEQLARAAIPSWRISKVHNLDHFERVGFPVRLNSMDEIGFLLDTMQENRYQKYMDELDGLTAEEVNLINAVCLDFVRFQQTHFHSRKPILPISTILSCFALYQKICASVPDFERILEVGPGCGYLSFFLKNHKGLRNYSQIEACESFYLLQSLVNSYCFTWQFNEKAELDNRYQSADIFHQADSETELSPEILLPQLEDLCDHFPWWKIGEVAKRDNYYDLVTSNANLLEFNIPALNDYLNLFRKVLKPSGIFVVQCTGGGGGGLTVDQLIQRISDYGFTPLIFMLEGIDCKYEDKDSLRSFNQINADAPEIIKFTTTNALYVKEGHQSWRVKENRGKANKQNYLSSDPIVKSTYFTRKPGRRMVPLSEFVDNVQSLLVNTQK